MQQVESISGELVFVDKPVVRMDCSVCKKTRLDDDEKYLCELCGSIERHGIWHP